MSVMTAIYQLHNVNKASCAEQHCRSLLTALPAVNRSLFLVVYLHTARLFMLALPHVTVMLACS